MPASQGFDEGSGGNKGPLDRRGHLPRDVPERSQLVNVLGHAGEVEPVKGVLGVQHLQVIDQVPYLRQRFNLQVP